MPGVIVVVVEFPHTDCFGPGLVKVQGRFLVPVRPCFVITHARFPPVVPPSAARVHTRSRWHIRVGHYFIFPSTSINIHNPGHFTHSHCALFDVVLSRQCLLYWIGRAMVGVPVWDAAKQSDRAAISYDVTDCSALPQRTGNQPNHYFKLVGGTLFLCVYKLNG